jgi:hypothetical protein
MQTNTVSQGQTLGTTTGAFAVGSTSATYAAWANINALMYSVGSFLSSQQLQAWAASPWAFWYPQS